jgi:hypothetical protein
LIPSNKESIWALFIKIVKMKTIKLMVLCLLFVGVFQNSVAQTPGAPYFIPTSNPSSGGSAVVSAYNCSGSSVGTMTVGQVVSGVQQYISATVTVAGTYSISILDNNGVSWTKSGTFASTGSNTIILDASGTPTASGTTTFVLPTTPSCSFTRSIGDVFTASFCSTSTGSFPTTTTIGGTSVTITKTASSTDSGSLTVTSGCGLSPSGNYISLGVNNNATYTFSVPLKNVQVYGYGNESTENNEGYTATATLAGVSVPVQLVPFGGNCTANFVATQSGNTASVNNSITTTTSTLAFNISSTSAYDTLKITRSGSSSGNNYHGLQFCNATAVPNISSGGTAVVSAWDCAGISKGTITVGTAVSGVTQTITATVTTVGTYNISTSDGYGLTFAASGTFTATGAQTITLTATGTESTTGDTVFELPTTPSCVFLRAVGDPFSSAACSTLLGTAATTTTTIGGTIVTITKTTNGSSVATANVCGLSTTGNVVSFGPSQTATYDFNLPVKNIQVYGWGNESSEGGEGYQVTASIRGNPVTTQLVPFGGTCMANFVTTQSGNTSNINNTTTTTGVGLSFNVSSSIRYDSLTITRTSTVAGSNFHGLLLCNSTAFPEASSNGSAVVSSYDCSATPTGTMLLGSAVTSVSQSITANVTIAGTYSISTIANGVTFAGSGTFAGTGAQTITLTATGTPTAAGTNTFTLNTTPNCSFNRITYLQPSSNGSAIISALTCSTATAGTLTTGTAVSGVTQTINTTVTKIGTYAISTTANGVTFSGTGTFTTLGAQNVVLSATGTPTVSGAATFTLNTTPNCNFSRTVIDASTGGTAVVSSYSSVNEAGSLWLNTSVTGITEDIEAIVTTPGTYNITASVNGVTFAGSGTFAGTGAQTITLTATGTPTVAGMNTYTSDTTPNFSFPRFTNIGSLPAGITLSAVNPYLVVSCYDNDYLPFTKPTLPAELPSGSISEAAGGANETLINYAGTLTTTGRTIKIPYTVTAASVVLPANLLTINIPAIYTEDGISRDVTFSYNGATLTTGSGFINATLKSVGGTLNLKKLDFQSGMGPTGLGLAIAQFNYPTNSSGGTTNFELRIVPAIPDKQFGLRDASGNLTTHFMVYFTTYAPNSARTWLSNNLGANYTNLNNSSFNTSLKASSMTDFNAYGSLFQWGRDSDGHELMTWTSATAGTSFYGTQATQTSNPAVLSSLFITGFTNWLNYSDNGLWGSESSTNNPCPIGYRVPTSTEMTTYNSLNGVNTAVNSDSSVAASVLALPSAGRRLNTGTLSSPGTIAWYWLSDATTADFGHRIMYDYGTVFSSGSNGRAEGMPVRCISDYEQ